MPMKVSFDSHLTSLQGQLKKVTDKTALQVLLLHLAIIRDLLLAVYLSLLVLYIWV